MRSILMSILLLGSFTVGAAPFDGYDVVLLAGQSNMVGALGPVSAELDATHARVKQYGFNAQAVSAASQPLDHVDELVNVVGPGLEIGKGLVGTLTTGRQLLLVPAADGGTAFGTGYWQVGGTGAINAIARANAAMALPGGVNRFVGIAWHQGESDAAMSQATYAGHLDALIAAFRSGIAGAIGAPFVAGKVPAGSALYGAGVNAAIVAMPSRVTGTAVVDTSDLARGGDNVHLTASSARTLGQRYAASLMALMQ